MVYADDTQVYIMFDPSARKQAIASIEACVSDIRAWAKTEIVHISSRFRSKTTAPSVQVGTADIKPVEGVRDLGVFIDNQLTMSNHVSNVWTALYALRSLSQLRKYLDKTTTEHLVHAFISSRLDSCNCLLYGLPDADIAKLQRVQNSAARLVVGARRRDHIQPILRDLHLHQKADSFQDAFVSLQIPFKPGSSLHK
ncbi:uncharacterized protein [Amphiura filiformis]|uniref:uncharacterized protein n=1 Tax=Amphiura filiformis TaxID=82378 RepID=UPI003B213A5B